MSDNFLSRLKRLSKKSPTYILERLKLEAISNIERLTAPRTAKNFKQSNLLKALDWNGSLDELTSHLKRQPFILDQNQQWPSFISQSSQRIILKKAQLALERKVQFLGSDLVELKSPIDWNCDFKTGFCWEPQFHRSISYNNPEQSSDVKIPWELSRFQWVLPLGQAYLLTGDEAYAESAANLISEWIEANPYAMTVNWACTMDVALRAMSWIWLFYAFKNSSSWSRPDFHSTFLTSLFLHGRFTEKNLEKSDINGNHYTADAAGLVFVGLFFSSSEIGRKWASLGWNILNDEILKQVFADGVDFEASVPYHRLVAELFALPLHYRNYFNLPVEQAYLSRLSAMGTFTRHYCRNDGSVPMHGDADDARALPLGTQDLNDHRYLIYMIGAITGSRELLNEVYTDDDECRWIFGKDYGLETVASRQQLRGSTAFPVGGIYIMANSEDHIYIDCAPIGLGGRGGHGHNDCLSFEACLKGEHLVTDAGAYLYTASYKDRNLFRSTSYHNTPRIDNTEINRFISEDNLWNFHYDAKPKVITWEQGENIDVLEASHSGYEKLSSPVALHRRFELDHEKHCLTIEDKFKVHDNVEHYYEIPLLLATNVAIIWTSENCVLIASNDKHFHIAVTCDGIWQMKVENARVSKSYGTFEKTKRLKWVGRGTSKSFKMQIFPVQS